MMTWQVIMRKIKMPKEPDEVLTPLTRRDFRIWAMRAMGVSDHQIPDGWTKEKQPGEG